MRPAPKPLEIPTTLRRFESKIAKMVHEGPDGYWIDLKPGWHFEFCHQVHGYTLKECAGDLSRVERCACRECRSALP